MNEYERDVFQAFKIDKDENSDEESQNLSQYKQIQFRRCKMSLASFPYIDCRFLSAAMCLVKNVVFSASLWILTTVLKSFYPYYLQDRFF